MLRTNSILAAILAYFALTAPVQAQNKIPYIDVIIAGDQSESMFDDGIEQSALHIQRQVISAVVTEYQPVCVKVRLTYIGWGTSPDMVLSGYIGTKKERLQLVKDINSVSGLNLGNTHKNLAYKKAVEHFDDTADRKILILTTDAYPVEHLFGADLFSNFFPLITRKSNIHDDDIEFFGIFFASPLNGTPGLYANNIPDSMFRPDSLGYTVKDFNSFAFILQDILQSLNRDDCPMG
jgi:hypothetical protein